MTLNQYTANGSGTLLTISTSSAAQSTANQLLQMIVDQEL